LYLHETLAKLLRREGTQAPFFCFKGFYWSRDALIPNMPNSFARGSHVGEGSGNRVDNLNFAQYQISLKREAGCFLIGHKYDNGAGKNYSHGTGFPIGVW